MSSTFIYGCLEVKKITCDNPFPKCIVYGVGQTRKKLCLSSLEKMRKVKL